MKPSTCFFLIALGLALFWGLVFWSLIMGLIAFVVCWMTLGVIYVGSAKCSPEF